MSEKYTVDESRDWYNGLPSKRSSAGMIVRHNDAILMVKDDYKPAMTFPGGVIDPNEAPRHAAIRETHEETNVKLEHSDVQYFTVGYIPENNGFQDRYHFFFITTIGDEAKQAIAHEKSIEYFAWVPVDEIAERAGNRPTYVAIQHMLQTNQPIPYFEVTKHEEGNRPWRT
jgi:ADP-ribose pyrophosphatase YjhB (NUDIX family)